MYQHLLFDIQSQTAIITLNRPAVLNALCIGLLEELRGAFGEVYQNPLIKGVILTGSGEKAFAAGADISELSSLDGEAEGIHASLRGQDIFDLIEKCPKPVIAAVNGFALGGGCELAMACHIRIASDNARFGQPEVKLGLIAGYGGTQRLVRHIGLGKATELLLSADMMDAKSALEWKLVNTVVSREELLPYCQDLLSKIYQQSALAVSLTLDAIRASYDGRDGYAVERQNFGKAITSEDGQEGTKAFLEKRKANFN